ncbi:hypothetical protein [Latilactobacillus sakei]|uniref:hypothetical protein n=1 Tax=Latilactobacillus sakei TaxID=1599 RepID=UPI001F428625|nr:hypothetical protein [Latilactobacillus sakei]
MTDIQCVIFDWAGTIIDFGSLDPVLAFQSAFNAAGIQIDTDRIRQDMGIEKHEHIAKLAKMPEVQRAWFAKYKRGITDADQLQLFNYFEQFLLNRLSTETTLAQSLEYRNNTDPCSSSSPNLFKSTSYPHRDNDRLHQSNARNRR